MKKVHLLLIILLSSFAFLSCGKTSTSSEITIDIGTEFSLFEMAKYHSIAITPNNEVYGWGDNQYGQLGELSNSSSEIVDLTGYFDLSANQDVIDIALGDFHSSILISDGKLFTWV